MSPRLEVHRNPLCLTFIGIPLGVASFKMAGAALVPFGKQIVSLSILAMPPAGAVVVPASRWGPRGDVLLAGNPNAGPAA